MRGRSNCGRLIVRLALLLLLLLPAAEASASAIGYGYGASAAPTAATCGSSGSSCSPTTGAKPSQQQSSGAFGVARGGGGSSSSGDGGDCGGQTVVQQQQQQPWQNVARRSKARAAALALLLPIRGGEVLEAKTLDELDEILSKAASSSSPDSLVVIDFTATWCGPCKLIAPLFAELAELPELKEKNVVFVKVDVDENSDAAQRYEVSAMPTFLFLRTGENGDEVRVVERLMGANGPKLKELVLELA